jgi:trimeric autotransporter adhesin
MYCWTRLQVLGVKQRTLRLLGAADGVPVMRGFIEYLADTGHYSDALAVLQAAQLGRGTIAEDPRLPAYTGLLHMVLSLLDTLQARNTATSTNSSSDSSSDTSSVDGDAPHEQQEERVNKAAAAAPVTLPDLRDPFSPELVALLREAFAAGAGTPRCDNLVEARRQLALAHRKPALIKSDPTVSGAAGYLAAILGAAGEAVQGRDLLILVAQRSDAPRDWELLLRFIETFCCDSSSSARADKIIEDDDAAFDAAFDAAAAAAAAAAASAAVAAGAAAWLQADPLAVLPLRRLCDMKLHSTTATSTTDTAAATAAAQKSSKGKGKKRKAQQQQQLPQPKLPSRRALVRAVVHQLEQHATCRPRGTDVAMLWQLLADFLGPLRARYTEPAVQLPYRATLAQAAAARAAAAAAVWSGAGGCDAPQHPLLAGLQLEWWSDVYFYVHTDLCNDSTTAATAAATATAARVRQAASEQAAAAARSSTKSSYAKSKRSSRARRAVVHTAAEATDSESGSGAQSGSTASDDDAVSSDGDAASGVDTAATGAAAAGAAAAGAAAADAAATAGDAAAETSSGEDEPVDSEMKALASGDVLYYVPPARTTASITGTTTATAATAAAIAELSSDSDTDAAAASFSSSGNTVLRGIKPDMSALAVDPKGEFVLSARYKKAAAQGLTRAEAAAAVNAVVDSMEADNDSTNTSTAAAASEHTTAAAAAAAAAAAGGSASKDSSSGARVSFEAAALQDSSNDEQEQEEAQQQPQRKRARRSAAQFEGLRTAIDIGEDASDEDDDDLGLTKLFSQSQSQSVQLGMGADNVSVVTLHLLNVLY